MNSKSNLPPKIYFKKQIQQLLNLNIQTIRRMWNRGEFPRPLMINKRCAWRASEIHQWLSEQGCQHSQEHHA